MFPCETDSHGPRAETDQREKGTVSQRAQWGEEAEKLKLGTKNPQIVLAKGERRRLYVLRRGRGEGGVKDLLPIPMFSGRDRLGKRGDTPRISPRGGGKGGRKSPEFLSIQSSMAPGLP